MIIWCNEASSGSGTDSPPPGTVPVTITRIEKSLGNTLIWFALEPAVPAVGGMPPDPVGMLTAMAGMHHEWFEAWQAAGFDETQAYGLVAEIVRAGFSQ